MNAVTENGTVSAISKEEKVQENADRKDEPKAWDLMADESKELLYHKHIVCQIQRSKNDNRVMYMANMTKDGKLNPAEPLKAFWLKIEKSYIEKRRKSGIKDDRTELTFMENNMAYGITTVAQNDEKTEFQVFSSFCSSDFRSFNI